MSFWVSYADSSAANSTFYSKLSYTATSSTQTIAVAPPDYSEVGDYTITLKGCLVGDSTKCQTASFTIYVYCYIFVKILQASPLGIL